MEAAAAPSRQLLTVSALRKFLAEDGTAPRTMKTFFVSLDDLARKCLERLFHKNVVEKQKVASIVAEFAGLQPETAPQFIKKSVARSILSGLSQTGKCPRGLLGPSIDIANRVVAAVMTKSKYYLSVRSNPKSLTARDVAMAAKDPSVVGSFSEM